MKTYYLLESAGTMEWEKIGLFDTIDEAHHWLVENQGCVLDELVEDAKQNYDMYEIKITSVSVLADTHDINEDC